MKNWGDGGRKGNDNRIVSKNFYVFIHIENMEGWRGSDRKGEMKEFKRIGVPVVDFEEDSMVLVVMENSRAWKGERQQKQFQTIGSWIIDRIRDWSERTKKYEVSFAGGRGFYSVHWC